jgi:hypothetical protein
LVNAEAFPRSAGFKLVGERATILAVPSVATDVSMNL